MADLILKRGAKVSYQGRGYRIESAISLDLILLKDLETKEKITAKIKELAPLDNTTDSNIRNTITDLALISNEDWEEAKRR